LLTGDITIGYSTLESKGGGQNIGWWLSKVLETVLSELCIWLQSTSRLLEFCGWIQSTRSVICSETTVVAKSGISIQVFFASQDIISRFDTCESSCSCSSQLSSVIEAWSLTKQFWLDLVCLIP